MADTKWLQQRRQGWYCVQAIPRALRQAMGKNILIVSLHTRDLRVAQTRRHDALAEFARVIAAAKRQRPGDPVAEIALRWRQALEDDRSRDTLVAVGLESDYVGYKHGEAAAGRFADIALGQATPLLHHVESWLAEGGTKGPLRPRTQAQFRSDLARLADWLGQAGLPVTIEAVTPSVASRFVTEELLGQGVHRATGNRKISAASSYWRWLIKRAGVTVNPWRGQSLSKTTRAAAGRTKRPFTEVEVITLLSGPADTELADVMRVAALTGARLEEIYRLQVRDCVDGWFDIRESKTAAGVRRVPIHTDLAALVARRVAGKGTTAFLFHEAGPAQAGRERSSAISKRFGRYRQALGVHDREEGRRHSRVDFHSWRRWFVTEARRAGIDRAVVAAVVGHETGSITDDVYSGGPGAAQLRACVEAVRLPV